MKITGIPALEDNYIWIITQGHTTLVIDPSEAQPVIDWLIEQQREPTAILITHDHYDHIGGIFDLCQHYNALSVYANTGITLATPYTPLTSSSIINIDGIDIEILDLSGHTPNQIGFYLAKNNSLFCGDALFSAGCSKLFNGGTAKQMVATLNRITALPSNTYIYCAHEYTLANLRFAHIAEPENNEIKERLANTILLRQQNLPTVPSLLSVELATNPFLRTETSKLHHTIDAYSDIKTTDPVTRFTYLRAWKDKLDATGILEII